MKISRRYIEDARRRGYDHLSATFARDVIHAAGKRHKRAQLRVAALTAAICIGVAMSVHWLRTDLTERKNLEAWKTTAAQTRVLQESI
jgi:hypothetical protein